VTYPELPR
jgi:hypothetical protein